MSDILETPLPEGYYDVEGWVESLLGHYGEKQHRLPVEVLEVPMDVLAVALYTVTEIYGNFPEIVYNALRQTIDPLFESDEYIEKIHTVLKTAGEKENRPLLIEYADALLVIRNLFQRDKDFYITNFEYEISQTPIEGDEDQYEKFTSVVSDITKIHVSQIRRMIAVREK